MNTESAEAEIRTVIEDWAKAVRARDLDGVVANHTSDMVMFDVPPPVALRGIEAYRTSWPDFFDWQRKENGAFVIHSLEITAGTDVAFATAILMCASEESRTKDPTPKLRLSVGLRKEHNRWLIAHEHHSFPLES